MQMLKMKQIENENISPLHRQHILKMNKLDWKLQQQKVQNILKQQNRLIPVDLMKGCTVMNERMNSHDAL